jgi:TetR/AcrR family transcriptional regulator, mexJK operon transcriptional repressor
MKDPETAKPRRGRPSLAQASAIDRTIVQVAQDLFLASGFDQVSMEQVAAAAGVSKGTLYARYASKDVLFAVVIKAAISRWSAEAAIEDGLLTDDIEQRLRHHARTIARFLHRPDVVAMQRLLMAVSPRFPKLAETMHDRGYRYIVDLIVNDIVEAEQARGRIPRDPEGVAHMLVAGLTGYQMQVSDQSRGGVPPLSFADRLVDIAIAGRSAW